MSTRTRLDVGVLQPFHDAAILAVPDVQVAAALMRIGGHPVTAATAADTSVALGAALCVRALRAGSVCVDLSEGARPWAPEGEPEPAPAAPAGGGGPASAAPAGGGAQPASAAPAGGEAPVPALAWPDPTDWLAAARAHPLVAQGIDGPDDLPLRLVGSRLYLQRYWLDEQLVRTEMARRASLVDVDPDALADGLARLFDPDRPDAGQPDAQQPDAGQPDAQQPDPQRLAAATAALRLATVVAGGPGTGKTYTVARIVALLRQLHGPHLSVGLAAPTGKAAARLAEALAEAAPSMDPIDQDRVRDLTTSTLHRLLGWRPDSSGRFRHDRSNPLPHDVVIVDETSMVSLPLMARLLEAVRPDARLVLVGDPDQLASIDAGAVLGDLVHAPAPPPSPTGSGLEPLLAAACPREAAAGAVAPAAATGVVTLERNYRFDGGIGRLASAIRSGQVDEVLAILAAGNDDLTFLDVTAGPAAQAGAQRAIRADVLAQSEQVVQAAQSGEARTALAALEQHRVLCAHREGPHGVRHWNGLIAGWTDRVARPAPGDPWYVGRPLLVTANDYTLELYNGDTGVIIADPVDGMARAAFARGTGTLLLPPARLDAVDTLSAMTIHRGQGSQFDSVTLVLPPEDSPLLTRELLYTAVTRARNKVRIVGTPDAVRAGVRRHVRRASGLGHA